MRCPLWIHFGEGENRRREWAPKLYQLLTALMLNLNSSGRINEQATEPMPETISNNTPGRHIHQCKLGYLGVGFGCICAMCAPTCVSFHLYLHRSHMFPRMGTLKKKSLLMYNLHPIKCTRFKCIIEFLQLYTST